MNTYSTEYSKWLSYEGLSEDERNELLSIENDEELKALRFSAPMDFGTAGLRAKMYMGIGCMNRFTVAQTTRGIAALVKAEGGAERGVAIAYDSRNNSELFAKVSASVLAGAGIKVYIFDGIRPTPELSFALRELGAVAGINITASHNPKEYNGYKAYWEDGAQISPEQAKVVSGERAKFDVFDMSDIADFDKAVKIVEEEINAFTLNFVSPSIFDEYDTLTLLQGIQAYFAGTERGLKDAIGNNSYIFNKKKLLNTFTINDLFRLCDKYNLTLSVSRKGQTAFELRPCMIKKKTE